MNAETVFSNDFWNSVPPVPPRSRLYHLRPVGVGTSHVESLAGYVARLAAAHHISVFALFRYLLAPAIGKSYVSSGRAVLSPGYVMALNGGGLITSDMVEALQSLTMRTDLRLLTMLPWADSLSTSKAYKASRAWCPACYEDGLESGQEVYEQLIWMLADVEICPKHLLPLCVTCPHCKSEQRWLTLSSLPGLCSKCHRWLGNKAPAYERQPDEAGAVSVKERSQWVADNLGALLAVAPTLEKQPTTADIAQNMSTLITRVANGCIIDFAKIIGMNAPNIYRWNRESRKPGVSYIVEFCYRIKISIADFLTGSIDQEESFDALKFKDLSLNGGQTGGPRKYRDGTDWSVIGTRFRKLVRAKTMPPSLAALAREWDVDPVSLRYHFPDLCQKLLSRRRRKVEAWNAGEEDVLKAELEDTVNVPRSLRQVVMGMGQRNGWKSLKKRHPELCEAISERFRAYQIKLKRERDEEVKEEVRRAAYALYNEGFWPTFPKVTAMLRVPSRMSGETARTVLREIQLELKNQLLIL